MRLGDFLRKAPYAKPVNAEPVTFTAIGHDENADLVKAEVSAVFIHVDEDRRQEVGVKALEAIKKRFGDRPVPRDTVADEEEYQLLFLALREAEEKEGAHAPLCDTVDELRGALVKTEASALSLAYQVYLKKEFPSKIDADVWAKMVEDAKTFFVGDLLTAYGFAKTVTLLSSLAAGRSGQ